jgi:O-acetyl-ADP-ribose deacetylase (regulator of RNase III)
MASHPEHELRESFKAPFGTIELIVGNIVDQAVDAIVNAANTSLAGGGGVDGAIHRAAGPKLLEECLLLPLDESGRRCPTGEVRTTGAGRLSAHWVIHAVGPYYNERYAEKCRQQLRDVHQYSLEAAAEKACMSIAFPAISTGAYRFPLEDAAPIALGSAFDWLSKKKSLELIRFVLFKPNDFEVFRKALKELARS